MDADQAISTFVRHALPAGRAGRYAAQSGTVKGRAKLLRCLDHVFERAIRPAAVRGTVDRAAPCYAFHVCSENDYAAGLASTVTLKPRCSSRATRFRLSRSGASLSKWSAPRSLCSAPPMMW